LQCAKGNDLGDAITPVFLLNVADHLVAPVLAEIDVEIRHRHPLGVEKPLEQQPETQRVEIGDRQSPGDDRARARPASGTDRDPLALRPLDDVGDDQEIAGKSHPHDRVELEVEALAIGRRDALAYAGAAETLVQPDARRPAQCHFVVDAVSIRKDRKDRLARLRHERAAAGDDEGVVAGLRQIGEDFAHLRGRAKEVMRRQPLASLVGNDCGFGDAQ